MLAPVNSDVMRIKAPVYTAILIFSLIGLLLVGLFLPGIIGKSESAKSKADQAQLARLSNAIIAFHSDMGELPSSLELLLSNEEVLEDWNGPYITKGSLESPWGSSYVYETNGPVFQIKSYGKDNKPGGETYNADLVAQTNVDE